jgi:hypothetical protein
MSEAAAAVPFIKSNLLWKKEEYLGPAEVLSQINLSTSTPDKLTPARL